MRVLVLLWVVFGAGCLETNAVDCANGETCPNGKECDLVHSACVLPDQLKSCVGVENGMPCRIEVDGDGICDKEVCIVEGCGDGYIRGGEQCDGEVVPEDADCLDLNFYVSRKPTCTADCTFDKNSCEQFCGDHTLQPAFEICEGDSVPTKSCVDYGYGAGVLGCLNCGPETSECIPFGWQLTTITQGGVLDLHGTADNDVFAIVFGNGGLIHFDGTTWSTVDLSGCGAAGMGFDHVWSPAPGVAFATGGFGVVVRVMGSTCTKETVGSGSQAVAALWAGAANDAWISVDGSGIWHFDGSTWTPSLALTGTATSFALWGSGADVYSISYDDKVRHFMGGAWQAPFTPPGGLFRLEAVWGSSPSDVYVSGYGSAIGGGAIISRYNGTGWTNVLENEAVLGQGESHVVRGYAVGGRAFVSAKRTTPGEQFYVLAYDGTGWSSLDAPVASYAAVWASSSGTVMATTQGAQIATLAGSVRVDYVPGLDSVFVPSVAARAGDDAYAVYFEQGFHLSHWDGAHWTEETSVSEPVDLSVSPGGSVFAVSDTTGLWYEDGTGWQNTTSVAGRDVWAVADDDVWILDDSNHLVYRWRDALPTQTLSFNHTDSEQMEDIYAASATNVFVVGQRGNSSAVTGSIQHWDGVSWTDMTLPAGTNQLISVWGRSGSDVYAIETGFRVFHYDGVAWSVFAGPGGQPLRASNVWGAPNDLFAATAGGIDHFDGQVWNPVDPGGQLEVTRITGAGDSVMFVDLRGYFHQLVRLAPWPAH